MPYGVRMGPPAVPLPGVGSAKENFADWMHKTYLPELRQGKVGGRGCALPNVEGFHWWDAVSPLSHWLLTERRDMEADEKDPRDRGTRATNRVVRRATEPERKNAPAWLRDEAIHLEQEFLRKWMKHDAGRWKTEPLEIWKMHMFQKDANGPP